MNALFTVLVVMVTLNAVAQSHNYRVIAGRLFDFQTPGQKYTVQGTVARKKGGLTVIEQSHSGYVYRGSPLAAYQGPGGMLQSMAAYQLSSKNQGMVSAGQYYSMSPEMRLNFKLENWTDTYVVTNCMLKVGTVVRFPAWPLLHDGKTVYDCGQSLTGKPSDYPEVIIVVGDLTRIQKTTSDAEDLNAKAQMQQRVNEFYRQMTNSAATNK
jgi:hypothetical protein